jgi:hypothetical protein
VELKIKFLEVEWKLKILENLKNCEIKFKLKVELIRIDKWVFGTLKSHQKCLNYNQNLLNNLLNEIFS